MFDITSIETLSVFSKIVLAVAGAASFWGCLFILFSRKAKSQREAVLWHGAAQKVIWPLFFAILLFIVIWTLLAFQSCAFCVSAHEGIAIAPEKDYSSVSLIIQKQFSAVALTGLAAIIGLLLLIVRKSFLIARLHWLFGFFLAIITIIYVYPWREIESFREGLHFALHNWHSILTLGSVIVVDFLYITLRHSLRDIVPKIFSFVTFGIWVGLGLDFVGSGLVFKEEFSLTTRVIFMQSLIGVIILNGVVLSGPIARGVLAFQKRMQKEVISLGLHRAVGISGAISLASWASVTALDGFRSITLSYLELLGLYIFFIIIIYFGRELIDKILLKTRVWR